MYVCMYARMHTCMPVCVSVYVKCAIDVIYTRYICCICVDHVYNMCVCDIYIYIYRYINVIYIGLFMLFICVVYVLNK